MPDEKKTATSADRTGKAGHAPGHGAGHHTGGTRPESKTESARERPTGASPPKSSK
jgi:hypothetical protein